MNIPVNDAPVEQALAIAPPTRMDDQIFPPSNWVPIAKSCIAVIWMSNGLTFTKIFSEMLSISFQPMITIHFVALPLSDTVIEYVNTLAYPSTLRNVSAMSVNVLYQPWRAILSMINMYLIEFIQSIQTFLTARKNLATSSRGKKKTTHLLIPSVRFTKLIIHHLKTKHNIHPRSGSPLHYSHDENFLNTLRYVGKDGREIFGMLIPDALVIDEIKGAPYYDKYQEHVAKYQQYLDAVHGKAEEGEATESPKATKKQKLVQETPDEPSPTKRSKGGLVRKIRKPMRLLKLVDEPSAEDVLVEEPAYNEEEANLQRDLELSLKEQAKRTQGLARPVVIREPDSGRIQPLPNVQGKGKEKVVDEQATHDLLTLQTPKKKSHELALTDSETKSNDVVTKIYTGDQDEGKAGTNPESQPQSSHVVHARPNLKPIDLEATDASPLQNPEKMNQGTNAEAEVYLMISVPIHQDTSSVPPMTTLVIDLMTSQSGSSLLTSSATTSTVSKAVDEIVTDAVDWAMQAPLQARFSDLLAVDMKEIFQQRIIEDKSYEDHKKLYDALEKSLERDYSDQLLSDMEEALQKKRKRRDVPRTPYVSPPP
nr:hypothetical protein [Tanacetum cinerariifolium]